VKRCLLAGLITGPAELAGVLLPRQRAPVYIAEPTIDGVSDELSVTVTHPARHLRLLSLRRHRYRLRTLLTTAAEGRVVVGSRRRKQRLPTNRNISVKLNITVTENFSQTFS